MGIEKYKAVFKGEIAPEIGVEKAKQHLAQLFKTDLTKIEGLFTGKPFILKEDMSLEEAQRYRLSFEKTGARCTIVKTTIVQETLPREPHPTPTQPTITTPPPPVHEVRYQVVFKGEILHGKEKPDVIANLCHFYKMSVPKVSQLFTGNPVTIKGPTDFWSAAEHVKRFKECGAICYIQWVEPTAPTVVTPEPAPAPVELKDNRPTQTPEIEEIKAKSNSIYESLVKAYSYVLMDYHIEKKSKSFDNHEGTMGCLFLLIIGGIIALLIWTSLRWYMGLIFGIGLIGLGTLFFKEWDLKYVDVFLSRMESIKKEDPALFLVTLNRWINNLPPKDRAKLHLSNLVKTAIQENAAMKPALDRYGEILGPNDHLKENDRDGLEKELEALESGETIAATKTNNSPKKVEGKIFCPSCGSTAVNEDNRGFSWGKGIIASTFLGPLGGAIVGSAKEGEPIYVCLNCNKKWKR